jgi:hypothetical protein
MQTNTTSTTTSTRRLRRRLVAGLAGVVALAAVAPGTTPAGAAPPGAVDILSAVGYDQPGPQGIHRIDWALPAADVDTVQLERWDAGRTTKLATYTQDAEEYEPTRIAGPFADGAVFSYRARAHNADGWGAWSGWSGTLVEPGQTHIRPYVDADAFVERQVFDFDAGFSMGQFDHWADNVGHTGEVTDFVDHLVGRFEVRHRAPVIRLYMAYFDRAPEPAGLDYWVDRLRTGTATLTSVSSFFSASAEYKAVYGDTTNAQFVTLVYQNVLDRDPDPAGFAYWKGRLDGGTTTRGKLMVAFSESAEGKALMHGETTVVDVWTAALDEQPTTAEVDRFVGHVDAGGTAGDIAVMLFARDDYPQP